MYPERQNKGAQCVSAIGISSYGKFCKQSVCETCRTELRLKSIPLSIPTEKSFEIVHMKNT